MVGSATTAVYVVEYCVHTVIGPAPPFSIVNELGFA
jgi:hypothetical protein